jgi:PPOX class probable F420-dependent enzyme
MAIDLTTDHGTTVTGRLQNERILWLTTTSADGTPQPNPIWFHWNGEQILIFSEPNQAKIRNIERNPRVSLNFNSDTYGGQIGILTGTATIDANGPTADERAAYTQKYADGIQSIGLTPDSMLAKYSVLIRVTPEKLRGF